MPHYSVFVEGLEAYGYNGASAAEREVGHRIVLDLEFEVNGKATATDDVADTLDYGAAAVEALAFVTANPCQTLEALGQGLASHLLNRFPSAESVEVAIRKPMPPMPAIAGAAGVRLKLTR